MKFQLLFTFFLFSLLSSSRAQSTSIFTRIFNPFNWFTARSNSSAVEIKHDEEVPITKTQVLPPLNPPPFPMRMHPMGERFNESPKIGSLDTIHIPLQMIPSSLMPKQIVQPQMLPTLMLPLPPMNGPIPVSTIPPRPNMIRKRIGLIAKLESRMEEDDSEVSVTTTPSPSWEIRTRVPQSVVTESTSEFLEEVEQASNSSVPFTQSETTISSLSKSESEFKNEMDVVAETTTTESSETTENDFSSTTIDYSSPTTVTEEPRPVYIDGEPEVKKQLVEGGEFLYESDFAKYLNQFYYSKPTVFDNLQMSKRHTPIFDTMKIN